ncbi:hypothetical protein [Clostridium magnum]|uniref:SbsA Ig-like domain-containing protein n=1 Tax=Clostridium magnum DSM 2767 TaxID=1121326 RepID=A0A161X431_9CLOT|nr:hypothetical protein [Clostridium magnum]KZL88596.1 hypothetical protein CLMAG_60890 [Clostridium magnum DSM 2767]SHI84139.1 hypothetical protein SAMN02745944_04943 [Clostridium magnum DSM 2767]
MNKKIITVSLISFFLLSFNINVSANLNVRDKIQIKSILADTSEDSSQFNATLVEGENYEFDNSDLLNSKQLSAEYDIYSAFDYVTYDSKGNIKETALNAQLYYKQISIPSGGKAVVTVKKLSSGKTSIKFSGDKSISVKEINETALFNVKLMEGDSYEFDNSDLNNSKQLMSDYDISSTFDYATYDSKGNIKGTGLNVQLYINKITVPAGGKAIVTAKKISGKDYEEFAGDKWISGKEASNKALFNVKLMEGDSFEFDNNDLNNSKQLMSDYDISSTFDYASYDSKGNIKRTGLNVQLYINKITVPAGGKAIVTAKKISGKDYEEFAGDKWISGKKTNATALFNVKLMEGDSYEFDNTDSENNLTILTNADYYSSYSFISYKEDGTISIQKDNCYDTSVIVPQKGKAKITVNRVSSSRDNIEFAVYNKIQASNDDDFRKIDDKIVERSKVWTVSFTSEVGYDDTTKQNVLVKDSKENLVNVSMELSQDKKSILIYPPQGGYDVGEKYTLYILDNAHSKNNKNIKHKVKMNFTISN